MSLNYAPEDGEFTITIDEEDKKRLYVEVVDLMGNTIQLPLTEYIQVGDKIHMPVPRRTSNG